MAEDNSIIGVAIIDDQHLFRQSLAMLIQHVDGLKLVADAANGREFLDLLPGIQNEVNVLLVDLDMPVMNGVALNKMIQREYPAIKVIILSVHNEERIMAQMIDAGAAGYLAKNCDKDELILAIQTVYKTGYYINPAALKALQNAQESKYTGKPDANAWSPLTRRETEVLQFICRQYTNAEIARELYISVRTVEGHRNKLLEKTGCQTTAGLAIFAVKHQLIEI